MNTLTYIVTITITSSDAVNVIDDTIGFAVSALEADLIDGGDEVVITLD